MNSTVRVGERSVELPDVITSRQQFKRTFGLDEMYHDFVFLPRALRLLAENRRDHTVDERFLKRLQLAVTEVSGCAACSYEHAKMALRQGMSGEEIASFLSGADSFVTPEEAKAIVFAQHFADTSGCPQAEAFEVLVDTYGDKAAHVMLSAVQVMLAGNMLGIPLSAFQSRRRGKPYPDSSLTYELGILAAGLAMLPAASVHGVARGLLGLPNHRFDCDRAQQSWPDRTDQTVLIRPC